MDAIEACNVALATMGQARKIASLDERSPEAEACKLVYQQSLNLCLEANNWSFCRRDEVITEEEFLQDVVALPYKYAYSIPEDVMRILSLQPLRSGAETENMGTRHGIQFNFRNYDGKKIIATDSKPPFVVHYQCYLDDLSVCSPSFLDGFCYVLASKLAATLIRGIDGLNIGKTLLQLGTERLQLASAYDAQQGNYASEDQRYSSFIRARQ